MVCMCYSQWAISQACQQDVPVSVEGAEVWVVEVLWFIALHCFHIVVDMNNPIDRA